MNVAAIPGYDVQSLIDAFWCLRAKAESRFHSD